MTKQYITGADVLRALAEGRKVRPQSWTTDYLYFDSRIRNKNGCPWHGMLDGSWEIVEEPATDAALIAEMRALANDPAIPRGEQGVYLVCARMLEKRSVKP